MNQEMVARSLGASRPWAFLTVTLPQIRISVISAALLAFITSLDEVVISLFIAGGDKATLTRRMFNALRDEIDPTIAAISTLLILISVLLLGLTQLLQRSPSRGPTPDDAAASRRPPRPSPPNGNRRPNMAKNDREQLKAWIDEDRDTLVAFLRAFVRCRGPNPPGDTRSTADFITGELKSAWSRLSHHLAPPRDAEHRRAPSRAASPGKHLVLNGHIDVFPVADDGRGWTKDPWGGEIVDGKIYGRGVADMKCGTSASIWTYIYLSRDQGPPQRDV